MRDMSVPEWGLLARVFGRIGVLSFGGPAAQIALMHKELVERHRWLSEDGFLRALSLCMLLPGPEAMQLATYAGWRLRGPLGGLMAGLLFVLPGAAGILALAFGYAYFGQLPLFPGAREGGAGGMAGRRTGPCDSVGCGGGARRAAGSAWCRWACGRGGLWAWRHSAGRGLGGAECAREGDVMTRAAAGTMAVRARWGGG